MAEHTSQHEFHMQAWVRMGVKMNSERFADHFDNLKLFGYHQKTLTQSDQPGEALL